MSMIYFRSSSIAKKVSLAAKEKEVLFSIENGKIFTYSHIKISNYRYISCKLLDMLGYGSIIASTNTGKAAITKKYLGVDALGDADNPLVYQTSQTVNALPFLAYQKIYYDSYSNSQWEKHKAYAYNVDYWSGTGQISLVTDMIQLRYANYPKDYFMGMLPSSQYGSVSVLPSIS